MKKFLILWIAASILLAGCATTTQSQQVVTHPIQVQPTPTQPQACTEEAKICPDGSAVGRTGPNCAFAACPDE